MGKTPYLANMNICTISIYINVHRSSLVDKKFIGSADLMPALTIRFSLVMWVQDYPKSGYLLRLNQGCKVPLLLFVSSLKLTGKVSKKM
jgi:hypothetical protein